MNIEPIDLIKSFPKLSEHPSLAIAIAALVPPSLLIWCSTKFNLASLDGILLFCFLTVCTLGYCSMVVNRFFKHGGEKNNFCLKQGAHAAQTSFKQTPKVVIGCGLLKKEIETKGGWVT